VVFPVIGETLLEGSLLLAGNVSGFALPDGFVLIDLFLLVCDFFYLLLLLSLLLLPLFFNFAFLLLLLLVLLLLLLLLVVVISDLLLLSLLTLEFNWELDELRVLADDVLEFLLVQLLQLVILHMEDHAGAAVEALEFLGGGGADGEFLARATLPDVGLLLVLLGDDCHLVGD